MQIMKSTEIIIYTRNYLLYNDFISLSWYLFILLLVYALTERVIPVTWLLPGSRLTASTNGTTTTAIAVIAGTGSYVTIKNECYTARNVITRNTRKSCPP